MVVAVLVAATVISVRVVRAQRDKAYSLQAGDSGLRVTALQYLLLDAGEDNGVSGFFASQTSTALINQQRALGLPADGIAHRPTMQALFAAPVAAEAPYERRFRVKAAQTLLGLQGHPVAVDGTFSQATAEAVRAVQTDHGLTSSGAVDLDTWNELFTGERTGPRISETDQFLEAIGPIARASAAESGVPASVAIAQASQETGWGHSAPGNNYFGIKCYSKTPSPVPVTCTDRATKEVVNGRTIDSTESFRSYRSMSDSVRDHAAFLRQSSRYAPAFAKSNDPDGFARAVQQAGYATDPSYADSLISIMKRYDLYAYDK